MKKLIILIVILLLALLLFSQVEQHEVAVTNVEVSVRVLDGSRFLDDLTVNDFEVFEDGIPQKIEALYLVKKSNVERKEAAREFAPRLSRNFYLIFQLIDYNPALEESIDYLFNQVILPNDTMTIWTPMNRYNLSSKALKSMPKEKIAKEMKNILRKDIKTGSTDYQAMLNELKRLVRSMSSAAGFGDQANVMSDIETTESTAQGYSIEFMLPKYRATLERMENLRLVDEKLFITFAELLKKQEGENIVFFFYQREFRPEISPSILNKMQSLYQDNSNILSDLQDLFQFYHREIQFNRSRIKQTFADSSFVFNFIFMDKEPDNVSGIHMREQSEDVFSVFSAAAKATGGIVDNSQNPSSGFKNALKSSEAYYILYYSPADYKKDSKFKTIDVKVKNRNCKVLHRLGYFAT
jgi:hypothetical protein